MNRSNGSFFVFFVLFLLLGSAVHAQEAKLKAAFVYQFTRLLEWCPEGKSGDFVIALVGKDDEMSRELGALEGRKVGAQTIKVARFASVGDIVRCNMLLVPSNLSGQLGAIVSKTSSLGCVLVISDSAGAISEGAGISFVSGGGKLNFEVNTKALSGRNIKTSQQLLKLAQRTI